MCQKLSLPCTKWKTAQRVDVVAQGQANGLKDGFGSLDMSPGGLGGEEIGEAQHAAAVVDGRDRGPFLFSKGRPAVGGAIMLDQGANGLGQDLPVVGFLLLARFVTTQLLGSIDDCVDGNIDPMFSQTITNG